MNPNLRRTDNVDPLVCSDKDAPVEDVPRANTGVKIEHPEEMEEAD